jgi:hypothetical protein
VRRAAEVGLAEDRGRGRTGGGALGVRSDRTDRSRSSVISKVRSSKNGDRSVSFKTQDRASSVSVMTELTELRKTTTKYYNL